MISTCDKAFRSRNARAVCVQRSTPTALPIATQYWLVKRNIVSGTGMLFVRNPTGISHSPAEHVENRDAELGAAALAGVLERLLTN